MFYLAAGNLILVLKDHDVRPALLSGLVALLRPAGEVQQDQHSEGNWSTALHHGQICPVYCLSQYFLLARLESETAETTGSLSVFMQQAAAAKVIRHVDKLFIPHLKACLKF